MMILKTLLRRDKNISARNDQPKQVRVISEARVSRCPVNTLLTHIFSGIAWNG